MADGICDVPKCRRQTYMGWRPLSEKIGHQICEHHWDRHKNKNDKFNLFDVFGFKRPQTKTRPVNVKLTEHCACGRELQLGRRLCRSCAIEREKERKREYYHRSKTKKSPEIISLRCRECGGQRLPGHSYCRKCGQRRRQKSNRERQRRHYKKITVSEMA